MAFMMITCLAAYLFVFFPWQLAHHGEHGYRIDIKWIGLNNMQEKTQPNPIQSGVTICYYSMEHIDLGIRQTMKET